MRTCAGHPLAIRTHPTARPGLGSRFRDPCLPVGPVADFSRPLTCLPVWQSTTGPAAQAAVPKSKPQPEATITLDKCYEGGTYLEPSGELALPRTRLHVLISIPACAVRHQLQTHELVSVLMLPPPVVAPRVGLRQPGDSHRGPGSTMNVVQHGPSSGSSSRQRGRFLLRAAQHTTAMGSACTVHTTCGKSMLSR